MKNYGVKIAIACLDECNLSPILQKNKHRELTKILLKLLLDSFKIKIDLNQNLIKTPCGRLEFLDQRLDLNISHSQNYLAVILSFNQYKQAVGIDIEIPKIRDFHKIYQHLNALNELTQLNLQFPNLSSEKKFYLSWCGREAALKASGVGLGKLKTVQIDFINQIIQSPFIPLGKVFYHFNLPFILAYFANQPAQVFKFSNNSLQDLNINSNLVLQAKK